MKNLTIILLYLFVLPMTLFPCSAVNKTVGDKTLFGGNMDWMNPYTQIKVEPGINGNYGVIYFGYGEREFISSPGGVNEKGLALDFFSTPPKDVKKSIFRKEFKGLLYKKILRECSTVEEAIKLVKKYERSSLYSAQMMLVDKLGNSVIVEANDIIKKNNDFQIVTNFNLSDVENNEISCKRYKKALNAIDKVDFSVDGFEEILNQIKQSKYSMYPTVYSYIIDFSKNELHIYNFGNLKKKFTLNIDDVFDKGYQIIDIPEKLKNQDHLNFLKKYKLAKPERIEISNIDDYPGSYEFSQGYPFKIVKDGSNLYLLDNDYRYKMHNYLNDKFFFDHLDFYIMFYRNDSGDVNRFKTFHEVMGIWEGKKL